MLEIFNWLHVRILVRIYNWTKHRGMIFKSVDELAVVDRLETAPHSLGSYIFYNLMIF